MLKYRSEIDGLRALAVIPVILFHAGFNAFSGGFVGVDVFFVISGYLITTILLNELEAGNFSIVRFYERRARRILPALFFIMFLCLPFAWFWLLPQDMKSFSQSLVAVSVFASNILFWRTSGYFDTATELKPLIHTWSLSVEEQYYVLFPLFLLFAWRLGKRRIAGLLAIVAVISLACAQWGAFNKPAATFYLLPTRAWELLIGALIAFYYTEHNIKKHKHWQAEAGSALGFALIAYSIFYFSKQTPFPSLYALAPTIGAALIIVFATHKTLVGKLLGSKPFVAIGLISYSAYLWHQPMLAFARHRSLDEPSSWLMAALAIASIPLAYLTWRFVERPFRNKHHFSRKQVFAFSAVCSAIFIAIGLVGHSSKGYESRLPIEQRDANLFGNADVFNGSRGSDGSCLRFLGLEDLPEEVCLANSKEPKLLFVGDSHAMALHSSIFGKHIHLQTLLISAHSCPIYPNLTYTPTYLHSWGNNCTEISKKILKVSEQFDTIKTVVLSNYYSKADDKASRYWEGGKNLSNKDSFISGYEHLLKQLFSQGKNVIFVIDVPHVKYESKKCFQSVSSSEIEDCRTKLSEYYEERKFYLDAVAELKKKFPKLSVFDPASILCDSEFCEIKFYGKSLYNDKHHISVYTSSMLLREMQARGLLN